MGRLGHSFGGNVALEYALRYPSRVSNLVLLDTGAEGRWSLENASKVLAARGYSADIVDLAERWLNGEVPPKESFRTLMKLGKAYNPLGDGTAGADFEERGDRSRGPRRSSSRRIICCRVGRSSIASARSRCRRW